MVTAFSTNDRMTKKDLQPAKAPVRAKKTDDDGAASPPPREPNTRLTALWKI